MMNKCAHCGKQYEIAESLADDVDSFCQYLCEEIYMNEMEKELED